MKEMEKTGREKTGKIQLKMKEKEAGFLILSQPNSFEHLIFTRLPFVCILRDSGEPEVFTHYATKDTVVGQSWVKNINGIYPYNIGIDKKNDVEEDWLAKTVEYISSFDSGGKKIAIDFLNTPVRVFDYLKENLKGFRLVDFSPELNSIYSINTLEEIEIIKKAAKIAEIGAIKSKEFLAGSDKEITENELASYAEYHMRKQGVEDFFVRSSVASGYRTCWLGATESGKVIEPDELVDVDYSPVYRGYFADICRPISKKMFSKKIIDRCRIVEEALDIAIDSIRPGVPANSVDTAVKKHFRKYGHDGEFIHHTGHPVGSSWGIMIVSNSHSIIEEGMAFALEPGLYDTSLGGIRIEDDVYVTKDGSVNMMKVPRIL
ncbi:MAG: aminopeptidase P family protein [Actinobacteria bacterium]|nr:aminopeptidase P family protein [Actinomycetota bacterium]